ncbi:unnamed protein product [Heterobilharzia americana]|nr:unnamed protein product [Heterobilharzia americana]
MRSGRNWISNAENETLQIHVQGSLCSAKLAAGQIAIGGKESPLRVWDINNPKEAVFTSKNVRPTVLELPVSVWISDISFVPRTNEKLVLTASRHGELDLYDLRCGQRRPVARHAWRTSRKHGKLHVGTGRHSAALADLTTTRPITKALAYDNSPGVGLRVVAGNAVGELCVLDLRLPSEYSNLTLSDCSSAIPIKSCGSRAPEPPSGVRCLAGASGCITHCKQRTDHNSIFVRSIYSGIQSRYRETSCKDLCQISVTSFLINSTTTFTNIEKFLKKDDDGYASNETDVEKSQGISEIEQKEFEELWNQIPVAGNDDGDAKKQSDGTMNHKLCKRKRKK